MCVIKLTTFGLDNGLSPVRRQAIIWTNAWLLSIGPLGTNFSDNFIKMQNFSFMKKRLKISSAKWQPFCPGENELNVSEMKQGKSEGFDSYDWPSNRIQIGFKSSIN